MTRFFLFFTAVLAISGERGYTHSEVLAVSFEAAALYAVLGLVDRWTGQRFNRWWTSTQAHKALVAWGTRAIDGVYNFFRRTKQIS